MEAATEMNAQLPFGFKQESGHMPLDWENMVVGPEGLASLLSVSDRQIQKLAKKGAVETRGHGKYHLRNSLALYHKHLSQNAGRSVSPNDDEDYQAARTRREKAQADIAEIEAAKLKGTLIPASEVARAWELILAELKSTLLNQMPRRLAALLKGESNESRAKQVIRSEFVEALTQLSQMKVGEDIEDQ